MLKAYDVARFFIYKDIDGNLFDKELICKNSRTFYRGNARLNKYLHLAQNIYIAKTGTRLFEDTLYAYDNGAVVPAVQENYSILLSKKGAIIFDDVIEDFLNRIFAVLKNATIDDLIELSHEDDAWQEKHQFHNKQDQMMNSEKYSEEYKHQYADILDVMERMTI